MHERSLVSTLLAQVRQIAAADGAGGRVCAVRVQVGPLAGVEPALLRSAWFDLRRAAGLGSAALEVDEVALVVRCEDCRYEFEPVRFSFRCPACGGTNTREISGDGLVLASIVVEEALPGVVV